METNTTDINNIGPRKHSGSCHCGAVRFEVVADLGAGGSRCNCSICNKVGTLGAIVKPDAFKLLAGEEHLSTYEWGAKISKRFFCKHCGIHCFGRGYLAEVGGAYVSVSYNCLDGVELGDLKVAYWDGRHDNWYAGTRDTPWPILTPAAGPTPASAEA
jgi:hypothetical protein